MPSYTKERAGRLKLNARTDNPDQAQEQAAQRVAKPASESAAKPEKK